MASVSVLSAIGRIGDVLAEAGEDESGGGFAGCADEDAELDLAVPDPGGAGGGRDVVAGIFNLSERLRDESLSIVVLALGLRWWLRLRRSHRRCGRWLADTSCRWSLRRRWTS